MNNGTEDRPNSHLHPSVGATAKARATSKQAPNTTTGVNQFQNAANKIGITIKNEITNPAPRNTENFNCFY